MRLIRTERDDGASVAGAGAASFGLIDLATHPAIFERGVAVAVQQYGLGRGVRAGSDVGEIVGRFVVRFDFDRSADRCAAQNGVDGLCGSSVLVTAKLTRGFEAERLIDVEKCQ